MMGTGVDLMPWARGTRKSSDVTGDGHMGKV